MSSSLPVATYRLQFNRQFRFSDAEALVPYLKSLGISHLYASPIFRAREGSPHGYDVVDPRELNPELGTREELDRLSRALRARGMGLLLDIVPNHMAAHWQNPWWWDVLENGSASPWADFFDIDWQAADGRLLLPVLGRPLEEVLERGELHLGLDDRGFFVSYFDARFPLDPSSYPLLLDFMPAGPGSDAEASGRVAGEVARLAASYHSLPSRFETSRERLDERRRRKEALLHDLWEHYTRDPTFKALLDDGLARSERGGQQGPGRGPLDRLLGNQAYQLRHWETASRRMNYRRFFDITDLAGVRVEDPAVFDEIHRLVRELAATDRIQAVRVDHVDGLSDPGQYLKRLRACLTKARKGHPFPVWVEKILAEDEELPRRWPVAGTTGYDALNSLNGVFVDPQGLRALRGIYARFVGDWTPWSNIVYRQKKGVLENLFGGELHSLSQSLKELAERVPGGRTLTLGSLSEAVAESIACLPVYRTYVRSFRISNNDRSLIDMTLRESMRRRPRQNRKAWLFLKRVLLLKSQQKAWLEFVIRWQQLTGPVMAKGFEDTALYRYHRLVSLNEVGGDPGGSYASLEDFHQRNHNRLGRWPWSLIATSTHDTKRSEDVRARINVLSERPDWWRAALSRWTRWNRDKKQSVDGSPVPDRREEVLFYQTLLGAWPLSRDELDARFRQRLCDYFVKAAREAKQRTSWLAPNERHEKALTAFIRAALDPAKSKRFLDDFQRFIEKTALSGAINSVSQVLLKIAAPGIPDFYRGTELWDLSLVDPDNRRPVDFKKRATALQQLLGPREGNTGAALSSMLSGWMDGRVKLFTIHRALRFRAAAPELFLSGEYLRLGGFGPRRRNLCAFARRRDGAWAVAVVPRFTSSLLVGSRPPLGDACWKKTHLVLPTSAPDRWENVLTGEALSTSRAKHGHRLPLSDVLRVWPVALLAGSPQG